jgi:imidazole glycerol-phosphate synthase subunit HisH
VPPRPLIGVIDYGAGNLRSVSNALRRLSVDHFVSSDRRELENATKLILPGVGEARSAMNALAGHDLLSWLRQLPVPFLGICLGMQVLFERSTERETACLGLLRGTITRFGGMPDAKVPHMGWNEVRPLNAHPLFDGIPSGEFFYFVHSYYAPVTGETIGRSEHDVPFAAAVALRNYCGVQFHPEKSGRAGLRLIRNFVERC